MALMIETVLNSGDTAWMLASTALVLLMTPGLAFFMVEWFVLRAYLI